MKKNKPINPFWIIVNKEIADYFKSWRFWILVGIIGLTCMGSMYTSLSNIADAIKKSGVDDAFLFLKLYTVSDGNLPSYMVFIGFLGPLLGISLGFDTVNSEYNRGTVLRVLAQPIARDFFINAKFVAALILVSVLMFALSFLVMGIGLLAIGIPPTPEEVMRIIFFTLMAVIYIAFWLNMSIWFSVKFVQPATSALTGISIWLFFSIFYGMLVNVAFRIIAPSGNLSVYGERVKLGVMRFSPNQMFSDAASCMLLPSVRSLGPLTMQQMEGALPGPIPVTQSLLLVWPQMVGLIALTTLCFVMAYLFFMRRDLK